MTSIGQSRHFQIYIDSTEQATSPVYYDLKLDSGYYNVRLVDLSNLQDPASNVVYELRSTILSNNLGNCNYFTFQQYTGSYTPTSFITQYDFGRVYLQQRIDFQVVDRTTGLPHADFQHCLLTFEVERIE
jgi:hypothetical protein